MITAPADGRSSLIRRIEAFLLAMAVLGIIPATAATRKPEKKQPASAPQKIHSADEPGFADTEIGGAEGRIRDYLNRHGDHGVIDPELLLERTRQFQIDRERDKGVRSLAIGGSVWTSLGPTNGAGRATAVALHPTVPGTAIIGAASGGAWKTTDSGATWTSLTDNLPNLSIGAIGIAASNPSVIYLGTGEGGTAIDFIPGIGLLYSSDGGANWTLPSSVLATQIYKISVNPTNANELVVATNTGAYRSTTGQNGPWTRVITSASAIGVTGYGDVTDLVRDPTNALVMYAATWDENYWCNGGCSDPYNYVSPTILKSIDGGQTWAAAATNLPTSNSTRRVDRWSIAIAASSPQTLYAATGIYGTSSGATVSHIYKTTDGGATWTESGLNTSTFSNKHYLGDQAWYGNALVVSPADPNTVLAGGVGYIKSTDGGATWNPPNFTGTDVHVDAHEMRYDSAGTLFIANDGGIWTSPDSGDNAVDRNTNLVTRQYYSLVNDPADRNRMFGGMQDNGTNRRPDSGGTAWDFFSGSDGIQCGLNPQAPPIVYSTAQYGVVYRTMSGGAAVPPISTITPAYDPADGQPPFLTQFLIDPNNPAILFTTTYRIWRSTTGGDAWAPLPTTTTDGSTWQTNTLLNAIAIAPSDSNVLMAAQYATVFRSTDGGTTWVKASTGLPVKYVNALAIDPHNPLIAYASLAGLTGSSVYMTTNGGGSWTARSSGLPQFSAEVVRVDPTDSSALYCGTDVGVYRSTDAGASWTRFGTGLPAVSVYDLAILADGSILRAGTHGRGVWELTVTGNTNHQPVAAITTPLTSQTVTAGTTVAFSGTISDPDLGDAVTGTWIFPDSWVSQAAAAGASAVAHEFDHPGIFPVTLAAKDSHGAIGSSTITVTVPEAGDDCASAVVIPAAGPFPWTKTFNLGAASTQASDPALGPSCYNYTLSNSVWLSFTPATTGTYNFSACGSSIAAVVIGYTGNACGPYTAGPFCYTDPAPTFDCSKDPVASVSLTAGVPIRILVTSYWTGDVGQVALTVTQGSAFSPALAAVVPAVGKASGGTSVTLTGSGFVSGASVSFGGIAATGVSVLAPSVLTATTPAHAVGAVDVTVTNPGGSPSTAGNAFVYAPAASSSVHGDANGDGFVNGADVFYLARYLFAGGAAPVSGDVNGDGKVSVADIFYLINYLFAGGPAPV